VWRDSVAAQRRKLIGTLPQLEPPTVAWGDVRDAYVRLFEDELAVGGPKLDWRG
jgi:hypothetical protein